MRHFFCFCFLQFFFFFVYFYYVSFRMKFLSCFCWFRYEINLFVQQLQKTKEIKRKPLCWLYYCTELAARIQLHAISFVFHLFAFIMLFLICVCVLFPQLFNSHKTIEEICVWLKVALGFVLLFCKYFFGKVCMTQKKKTRKR